MQYLGFTEGSSKRLVYFCDAGVKLSIGVIGTQNTIEF